MRAPGPQPALCTIKSYSDQNVTGFFAKLFIVGATNERNGGLIHACLTGYCHRHHSDGWARRLFRPSREGRGDDTAQVALGGRQRLDRIDDLGASSSNTAVANLG